MQRQSSEFFYIDAKGRKTDRALHEEILGEKFPEVKPGEPVIISFPRRN
jgi:hypothetical protein